MAVHGRCSSARHLRFTRERSFVFSRREATHGSTRSDSPPSALVSCTNAPHAERIAFLGILFFFDCSYQYNLEFTGCRIRIGQLTTAQTGQRGDGRDRFPSSRGRVAD